MIGKLPLDQGRARGLYDEQLQRLQQEKLLFKKSGPGAERALFRPAAPDCREVEAPAF